MSESLHLGFTAGTHRLVPPEQTLARIEPVLARCGITRLAEITALDEDFGVPTFTAIRPGGLVLQTGNGKGLTKTAAKVSAAMEAIELFHAENPERSRLVRASHEQLRRQGLPTHVPKRDEADLRFFHSDEHVIDWLQAEELLTGTRPWIPASAAFFVEPTIYKTNTNGLASGNHAVEATLHALYELLERDAISRVLQGEVLDLQGSGKVVDPASIDQEPLRSIIAKITEAESQLVLVWLPAQAPVHVLWAFLLNHQPHRAATALTTGSGAHPDLSVAAARAITEAIQSRLTIVQAARDDIIERPSFARDDLGPRTAFGHLAALPHDTRWPELEERLPEARTTSSDLREVLAGLLDAMQRRGHDTVIRVSLQRADLDVPVVKVLVPSLGFRRVLF